MQRYRRALHFYLLIFLELTLSTSTLAEERSSARPSSEHTLQSLLLLNHLSSITILSTYYAANGYLWLATLDGIRRVEQQGDQTFHYYRGPTGESVRLRVRKIFEVWEGEILALTLENKLVSLSRGSSEFQSAYRLQNLGVDIDNVADAYFSSSDDLWLGYLDGKIIRISPNHRYPQVLRSLSSDLPTDFYEYENGNILVLYDTGDVFEVSNGGRVQDRLNAASVCHITATLTEVATRSGDKLHFGTEGQGVYILDRRTGNCAPPIHVGPSSEDLKDAIIHDIQLTASSQRALVGSDQGLFLCRLDSDICYPQFQKGSNSALSDVTSISRGNYESNGFWIGTYKGLFRLVESPFRLFDKHRHANFESIIGFAQISDSTILVASYNGVSLLSNDAGNSHALPAYTNLDMRGIMAVYGIDDELYVGYRNRGFEILRSSVLSSEIWNKSVMRGLKSDSISSFLKTEEGHQLIGTYGRGVAILNREEASAIHVEAAGEESSAVNQILFIFQSSEGTIWLGTEAGLRILDLSTRVLRRVEFSAPESDLLSEPIIWTAGETDSFVWFGSAHDGLFKYRKSYSGSAKPPSIEKDSAEMPPLGPAIYSIQSGVGDEIWFSTDRGISRRGPEGTIVHYGEEYGVSSIGFELNSSFKDARGFLYFGGEDGFYRFCPDEIRSAPEKAKVRLHRIEVGNKTIRPPKSLGATETITLTHKDRFLTLNFSTRDLTNVDTTRYRHKLEGFDDDWVDIGNRGSATYTNLPAGSYVFKAQALNASGVWSPEGVSIGVTVKPAPWRTWWAYTLYGLFVLAIVYLMLRVYRERMLKEQAEKQADEMQRIADQFADEVQDQMDFQRVLADSMHRYNKELLAWANVCIRRSAEYAHGDASALQSGIEYRLRVLDLVQDALYYRGEQLYLDPHAFVSKLFTLAAERHPALNQRLTAINDATNELLPASQAIPIAVIVGELFENSLSHSFAASQGPCYLRIALTMPSVNEVQLEIQDNGVGIPAGLSFEAAEFAGFAIVADAALAARGALTIGSDRKSVLGQFLLAEKPKRKDQRP